MSNDNKEYILKLTEDKITTIIDAMNAMGESITKNNDLTDEEKYQGCF